jgi:hypothetical protein
MAKLEQEIETYNTNLSKWTEHEGEFVLIHEDKIVGFFSVYEEALRTGYEKFGIVPFLVKQVSRTEKSHFVSRFVAPHTV